MHSARHQLGIHRRPQGPPRDPRSFFDSALDKGERASHHSHCNTHRDFSCELFGFPSIFLQLRGTSRSTSVDRKALLAASSIRSSEFHHPAWRWPFVSILFLISAGILTSGWSMLLTPVPIIMTMPLVGSEIDLASPNLREIWRYSVANPGAANATNLQSCVLDDLSIDKYQLPIETLPEGEYDSGQSHFAYSSRTTSMPVNTASTKGILPVYFSPMNASQWLKGAQEVPASIAGTSTLPVGLVSSYPIIQQGTSGAVACTFQNLTNATKPALTSHWSPSLHSREDIPSSYRISADCSIDNKLNVASGYAASNDKSMLMLACKHPDNYMLIFVPRGVPQPSVSSEETIYQSIVCTLTPAITKVYVDYPRVGVLTIHPIATADPDGPGGFSAVAAMHTMMQDGQGMQGSQRRFLHWDERNSPRFLPILEQYVVDIIIQKIHTKRSTKFH
ncbi:hypothetical protein B0H19DRAFT_1232217 [Mycena capillaripes]|nr:hypothetical protein B0H19DRAFT_1232217 [Mycena capillaripes]